MKARAILAACVFAATPVRLHAAEVTQIALAAPVSQIVAAGAGVFVETGSGRWFRLEECGRGDACAAASSAPGQRPAAPSGGLPDGGMAMSASGDIRRAWYARPTGRYGHGVLGDAVEAGSLVAEDTSGRRFEYVLDEGHVFEDLTPRIADLDGDGRNEIVAIRSSLRRGAALAILGMRGGKLSLLDAAAEIGQPNRWLNVAGIGNYLGDGRRIVAWVETPHIGGTLRMAAFAQDKLAPVGTGMRGFSNHIIGSRELAMSATGDFDGDGIDDLAVPSANRRAIAIVGGSGNTSIALPGRVAYAVAAFSGKLVTATEDGRLLVVAP